MEKLDEIKSSLLEIERDFMSTEDEPKLTMFGLISRYNNLYDNQNKIGGNWVRENISELKDLP